MVLFSESHIDHCAFLSWSGFGTRRPSDQLSPVGKHLTRPGDGRGNLSLIAFNIHRRIVRERHEHLGTLSVVLIHTYMD